MSLLEIAIFFGISFVAAAINSVAGGGTFLTFPVFILNGLTPLQANIMSTIALWPGTLASIFGYRGTLSTDRRQLAPFLVIGLIGGVLGAWLLLATPEVTFKRLVPWLMLVATMIFALGRRMIAYFIRHPGAGGDLSNHEQAFAEIPAFAGMTRGILLQFVIAVYGGYFGAGIGILTLAMLQLLGMQHIHRMNALKTILTCSINAATVVIFILSGKVLWAHAMIMVSGALLGGYVGARLALKCPPEKVRLLVIVIGFAMTAYFFIT